MQTVLMETPDGPRKMTLTGFFEFEGATYAELLDAEHGTGTIMKRDGNQLMPIGDEENFHRLVEYLKSREIELCPDCAMPLLVPHKRAKDCIKSLGGAVMALQRLIQAIGQQAIVDPERFMADLGMVGETGPGDVVPFRKEGQHE